MIPAGGRGVEVRSYAFAGVAIEMEPRVSGLRSGNRAPIHAPSRCLAQTLSD